MPVVVSAQAREGKFNKNAARRVRVAGKIPAVVYGAGAPPVAVEVDPKQITKILYSESGHNTIFDLEISGAASGKAMVVDTQFEPINDRLIHIDMKRIAMDKLLTLAVPVKLIGVPVGVKLSGGMLDQVLREVEIECLPADIPSHIDVDVSKLELNQLLRVKDLPHTGKIKFLDEEEAAVAHVISIKEEAAPAAAEGAEAAATEPEVAKKGKTEAEGDAKKSEAKK